MSVLLDTSYARTWLGGKGSYWTVCAEKPYLIHLLRFSEKAFPCPSPHPLPPGTDLVLDRGPMFSVKCVFRMYAEKID